ncbi:MAG: DUF2490 domain-containing protein, partial [Flavobacteriaceae bacterium]|nr:DUF2490 domain-containing protein [Flavobacteriaceae bacterium]
AQSDPEEKLGAWYSVFSNHRLADNWSIYNETNLNLYEIDSDLDQFWVITGLRRYFKNNITASVSYSYFYTDPNYDEGNDDELFGENRIFEQLAFNHTYGKIKLQHRYRLEHRIFDSKVSKVVTNRFRYRLAFIVPLNQKWFLQLADEVFINFNKNTFNQNRLIGNLGYKITPQLDFRAGYMKLHTSNRKFDRLLFTVNFSTDWRKPTEN